MDKKLSKYQILEILLFFFKQNRDSFILDDLPFFMCAWLYEWCEYVCYGHEFNHIFFSSPEILICR